MDEEDEKKGEQTSNITGGDIYVRIEVFGTRSVGSE
jgi:hypothetical protein